MLVLSRRAQQRIVFPDLGISLSVLQVRGRVVKLGIDAPASVQVKRYESLELPSGIDLADGIAAPPDNQTLPDHADTSDEAEHHRRNQLNTLQLHIDAIQMQLDRGEHVDVKKVVQSLGTNLDVTDYQVPSNVLQNNSTTTDQEVEDRPLRVLMVEDSDNERGLMTYLLASHGFTVYVARDGTEALEQLRVGCGLPDVVLLDIDMPFGNGNETLRHLRSDRTPPHLLIYAVTGSRRNVADEPVGRGWDRWFSKPVDVQRLVQAIREDCGRVELAFEKSDSNEVTN